MSQSIIALLIFLYFCFSLLVGLYADTKGRSVIGFILLSFVTSPIVGIIVALIVLPYPLQVIIVEKQKD